MPNQGWVALLNPIQVANLPAAVALANSTTLTDISPGGAANASYIQAANTLQVGTPLRVTAAGVFSTTGTPNLTIGLYYGGVAGVVLAAIAPTATASAAANFQWRLEWTGTVRSVGTAGSIQGSGLIMLGTSAIAISSIPIPNATPQNTVAIDTTANKAITIGALWGTANAANTILCTQFMVEGLG